MPRFDNGAVRFDVPSTWEDRSVLAFEAPRHPALPAATNVALSPLSTRAASPLAAALELVARFMPRLPGFQLVYHQARTLLDMPASEILFHWNAPDAALTERATVFRRGSQFYSLQVSALRAVFDQQLPTFERIATSIRFANADQPPLSLSSRGY